MTHAQAAALARVDVVTSRLVNTELFVCERELSNREYGHLVRLQIVNGFVLTCGIGTTGGKPARRRFLRICGRRERGVGSGLFSKPKPLRNAPRASRRGGGNNQLGLMFSFFSAARISANNFLEVEVGLEA